MRYVYQCEQTGAYFWGISKIIEAYPVRVSRHQIKQHLAGNLESVFGCTFRKIGGRSSKLDAAKEWLEYEPYGRVPPPRQDKAVYYVTTMQRFDTIKKACQSLGKSLRWAHTARGKRLLQPCNHNLFGPLCKSHITNSPIVNHSAM